MSNRTDAQAGIDAQKAKQGLRDSIDPIGQANDTLEPLLNGAVMIDELTELLNTYASVGYTQKQSNGTNVPLVISGLIGTGNEDLTPPDNPQPLTGGDYKGFVKISQFEEIDINGSLTIVNGEIVIADSGKYYVSHAWLDVSCTANGNNIGFIFGIERAGQYIFSQRPTGMRASNGQDRTNISGGGFLNDMLAGDKLSVWVASEKDATITVYDANLGLNLRTKD
jgi:hypothetical protein|tara:strand:+ start:183 stop:854 length:672 start_codon:yes stop_codon:yes gene_type:complete